MNEFRIEVEQLFENQEKLLVKKNEPVEKTNGWYRKFL